MHDRQRAGTASAGRFIKWMMMISFDEFQAEGLPDWLPSTRLQSIIRALETGTCVCGSSMHFIGSFGRYSSPHATKRQRVVFQIPPSHNSKMTNLSKYHYMCYHRHTAASSSPSAYLVCILSHRRFLTQVNSSCYIMQQIGSD